MSHFSVLVIGPDIEKQLAPYHEYECTGRDDEFVRDVDRTEEARKVYEEHTETIVESPDGERVHAYDDRWYRDPTDAELELIRTEGRKAEKTLCWTGNIWPAGHDIKVREIPEGWVEKKVPSSEMESFVQFCEHYYSWKTLRVGAQRGDQHKGGFVEVDEHGDVVRCVDRTNPDAKWDWYEIGGRWRGFFPLKADVPFEDYRLGRAGVPEEMEIREGGAPRMDYEKERRVDVTTVGDVDFARARDEAEAEGRETFRRWRAIYEEHGRPGLSWSQARRHIEEEIAALKAKGIAEELVPDPDGGRDIQRQGLVRHTWRERYAEQPAVAASRGLIWGCPVDAFGFDEDAHAQRCRARALVPYAVVKDGRWYARGEMGWWGISRDEKDDDKWSEEVQRLYDDLPPDTPLTVVDCHI